MRILPLSERLKSYLASRGLTQRFEKQRRLFQRDARHPSLNTELLEPKHMRVYSFRVTQKYRAVFIVNEKGEAEILDINDHYQ